MLGDAGACEHQRERVSTGDPVEARRLARRHAAALEHALRVRAVERTEREAAKARGPEPGRDRPLAPGEHQRDPGGQHRHEHLPQPRVHEPEQLVVVEREHDRRRQAQHKLVDLPEAADGMQEAARGGLDCAAVELDHVGPHRPPVVEEAAEQRGLADAGDPVQEHDWRPAVHAVG